MTFAIAEKKELADLDGTETLGADIDKRVRLGKLQIEADILAGNVSPSVKTFSELHDTVDANYYGITNDEWCSEHVPCPSVEIMSVVQDALHDWLVGGRV